MGFLVSGPGIDFYRGEQTSGPWEVRSHVQYNVPEFVLGASTLGSGSLDVSKLDLDLGGSYKWGNGPTSFQIKGSYNPSTKATKFEIGGAQFGIGGDISLEWDPENGGWVPDVSGFAGAKVVIGSQKEVLGVTWGGVGTLQYGVFLGKDGSLDLGLQSSITQGLIIGSLGAGAFGGLEVISEDAITPEQIKAILDAIDPRLWDVYKKHDALAIMDMFGISTGTELLDSWGQVDHCFLKDTPISMWPTDSSVMPLRDGTYNESIVLSKVWEKPISEIKPGDLVVSYDKEGRIYPGPVSRTMRNRVKHVLDFWGTGVTPGHAYFCADGKFKGQHVPLLDILRTDGTIMKSDGTQIRAATGCEVGSIHDRLVHAVAGDKQPDGQIAIREQGQVRLGTRVILENDEQHCVLDILNANGAQITEDGYIRSGAGGAKVPLSWTFSEQLPKPEDYILRRSKVTLEEIYAAGEWEQIGPRLPAPDGSKASPQLRKATPVGNQKPLATADGMRQPTRALNRKQRKAMEAKQRKAAKTGKRLVS
ncbi:conserved hypothetical protein [Rhodobacteraceae bacterium KLH11]|nr:conserved hypothetical protein [Rhodobacteraceae bacterium KLH11]